MQFVWMGFIKEGAEPIPQEVNAESNEFLSQPFLKIQSVGPLCDDAGRRAGMLMIFAADDRGAAEALVENSPYRRAGIYERYQLYEFRDEIG